MNIYQAAKVAGLTQKTLAKKLNVSVSTLYRRRIREFGGGRIVADSRDPNICDLFTGEVLADVAKTVLLRHGVSL